jgi:hypothetical protein
VVDTFYHRHKLTRDQIYGEKERHFKLIGPVHKFDVSNEQITKLNPTTAVVLFDKEWDFGDSRKFAGAERAQLTLGKFGNEWKITGERELKVYWVKRSSGRSKSAGRG